ncbi:carbohydrate sulfotransferase 15-like [Haliotis rubra]|uniref:carbohydrate sulfotransferase 15-like n=1 Tax=Haliotis rubra TaxID=36100 RepID=UPI001EE51E60|nr:carbohydrate sulfotransferase 15-like [Haliotis rubra]
MACCKNRRKRRKCIMTCLAVAVVLYTCRQLRMLGVVPPYGLNGGMDKADKLLNHSDIGSRDSCSRDSLAPDVDKEAMEKFKIHDLLRIKKHDFLTEYKNPCWRNHNTGELKCLPYFYLAGFAKCGTTFAFQTIFSHPDTAAPAVKESHWLSKTRFKHQSHILAYLEVFAPAAREIEAKQFHHQITGDGSASTVWRNHFWANLPGNYYCSEPRVLIPHYVHHLNPLARVIIMFRDPTERMISAYNHFDPGTGSAEHFHESMVKQTRMYTDCFARTSYRACAYNETLRTSASQGHHCQLVTGLYHVFIRDWLTVFPRDQILIIKMEDMRDHFYNVFAKIFKFLGLSPLPRSVMDQREREAKSKKRSKRVHMMDKTRHLLDDFYRPHNIQLTKLIGDSKHTGV